MKASARTDRTDRTVGSDINSLCRLQEEDQWKGCIEERHRDRLDQWNRFRADTPHSREHRKPRLIRRSAHQVETTGGAQTEERW